MTLSVLMSTYCKERPDYLDAALRSVWTEQVRKPDQIVLVEDGELSDALENVVQRWKRTIGEPLTLVANKVNRGLASALNDGIAYVTGDLIARMDSDDIAMPMRLKVQEKYMQEHEDVDILGGSIQEFNDEGTLDIVRHYPTTMDEVRKYIYRASPVAHPTVVFRKRFFDEGFRYSSKYHICEDVTLWFEAIQSGHIINNTTDVVLRFRRNDSVMKRRGREKAWNEFKAYSEGLYNMYGLLTYKHAYTVARLVFRLLPTSVIRFIYNGKIRKAVVKM